METKDFNFHSNYDVEVYQDGGVLVVAQDGKDQHVDLFEYEMDDLARAWAKHRGWTIIEEAPNA